jgi:2-dehydro-3-deoxyphosphogluconate aldolase/(4S)-4-hydroxy-2-oxoglutarate aldolase
LVPVFLREPAVAAVGGSWLAPRPALAARDWKTVTANARQVVEQVRTSRKAA